MNLRVAVAGATLLALALVGCAGPDDSPIESAPTTTSPSASPAAPVTPEETGPPPLSCNTIILEETVDGFDAAGYVHEVDYESQVRSDGTAEELFFDFGGISCLWYLPNSDGWFTASYSELTEAQASEARARLETEGFTQTQDGGLTTYTRSAADSELGHADTYVLEPGAWYHSSQPEGIDEIRAVIAERG